MSEEWSPFIEAGCRLNRYEYFFPHNMVSREFGGHPEDFEAWLEENCPKNYCYVWVWRDKRIVDDLVGVPENLVIVIKLMTSIDPHPRKKFDIQSWITTSGNVNYRVEQKPYRK